jgi:hypothetical protein
MDKFKHAQDKLNNSAAMLFLLPVSNATAVNVVNTVIVAWWIYKLKNTPSTLLTV